MEKVLFTRQRHEADRAGLHWDYRIVIGDKAHSWATKKPLPEPGKSIMLWQQPVHTADYALSPKVVIPAGQYGAGVTTLDWVKKGMAEMSADKIIISTDDGRFLLKKMPDYMDGNGWLFKNLGKGTPDNKYLTKASTLVQKDQNEEKELGKKMEIKNKYLDKIASFKLPQEVDKLVDELYSRRTSLSRFGKMDFANSAEEYAPIRQSIADVAKSREMKKAGYGWDYISNKWVRGLKANSLRNDPMHRMQAVEESLARTKELDDSWYIRNVINNMRKSYK